MKNTNQRVMDVFTNEDGSADYGMLDAYTREFYPDVLEQGDFLVYMNLMVMPIVPQFKNNIDELKVFLSSKYDIEGFNKSTPNYS